MPLRRSRLLPSASAIDHLNSLSKTCGQSIFDTHFRLNAK